MNSQPSDKSFSAFPALFLIAASVIILLSWNASQMLSVHSNGVRISVQQDLQLTQASQTEEKLKQMMSDLVELSKSDTDAETIVKRYKIVFNNPTPTKAVTPTPPPAKSAPKAGLTP